MRAVDVAPTGAIGRARTIGPADSVSTVVAGVARGGRAVIAWSTQDGGEERDRPLQVRAAIRPRAGAPFGPARTLDRGHRVDSVEGGMSLAVAPGGRAVLAWADVLGHDVDRLTYPLYTTVTGARGGFKPVQRAGVLGTVLRPGFIETTAFTPSGTAVVAYYRRGRIELIRRTPHAKRFSAPKAFGRAEPFDLVPGPGGHLLSVWTTYPRRDQGRVHVAPLRGG